MMSVPNCCYIDIKVSMYYTISNHQDSLSSHFYLRDQWLVRTTACNSHTTRIHQVQEGGRTGWSHLSTVGSPSPTLTLSSTERENTHPQYRHKTLVSFLSQNCKYGVYHLFPSCVGWVCDQGFSVSPCMFYVMEQLREKYLLLISGHRIPYSILCLLKFT